MPKYNGKTYSRTRSRESQTQSSSKFDEVQNDDDESETPQSIAPKKTSWSRISKAVEKTKEQSPKKKNVSKRAKLETVVEVDPFAFSDEDESNPRSRPSSSSVCSTECSAELASKSTDDEAYSSSQELSGSSQISKARSKTKPSSSPFKSFLKNNDKSLSPSKQKNLRRLSALPTSMELSEEDSQDDSSPPPIVRASSWPKTTDRNIEGAIKVKRVDKPLFTVIRNVKKVSECLESGEDQEFFDDVEYLLDGLQSSKVSTRSISALEVASRCTSGSFRVNLRAHGIIPKIFSLLSDAPKIKNLALCTSAIMYILTQDRQSIDLDKFVLGMMMKFLSIENPEDSENSEDIEYNKCITKIRSVLEERNKLLPGSYLELENICVASLARESLLSITTEKMGAWFKEEIRILGGLDHIVDTVSECVAWLIEEQRIGVSDPDAQAKINRVDKCLKFLENVTYQNHTNQSYLLHYKKGSLARALSSYARLCVNTITEGLAGSASMESFDSLTPVTTCNDSLFNTFKVFLNLSNDSEEGSLLIGQQEGFLSCLLFAVLQLPQFFEDSKRFDLHVLSLGLLINLVEHSKQNIATVVQLHTEPFHESQDTTGSSQVGSVEALMQLFIIREQMARDTDQMTSGLSTEDENDADQALVPTKDGQGWVCGADIDATIIEDKTAPASSTAQKDSEETLEEEIGKALVIAGKHMEDSMVASYVALLLGCIVQDNKANEALVRSLLPNEDFSLLLDVLKKFLGFMRLTSGTSGQAIEKIVRVVEGCVQTT